MLDLKHPTPSRQSEGRPAEASSPVRILLVEDSAVIRRRLRDLVEGIDGLVLASEAETLGEARRSVAKDDIDVVILDLQLPDGNGLDLFAELESHGRPLVIVLTNHSEPTFRARALREGAAFFFDKSIDLDRLVQVLTDLAAGR